MGGDFFDISYASYRNPYQPLKYYGIKAPTIGAYELSTVGESLIYGAPEIRLVAVQGQGSIDDRNTIVVQQTVIFMWTCVERVSIGNFSAWVPTGYYLPADGVPVDIKSFWDSNLDGSAITVKLTETDIADIVITDMNQETSYEFGL